MQVPGCGELCFFCKVSARPTRGRLADKLARSGQPRIPEGALGFQVGFALGVASAREAPSVVFTLADRVCLKLHPRAGFWTHPCGVHSGLAHKNNIWVRFQLAVPHPIRELPGRSLETPGSSRTGPGSFRAGPASSRWQGPGIPGPDSGVFGQGLRTLGRGPEAPVRFASTLSLGDPLYGNFVTVEPGSGAPGPGPKTPGSGAGTAKAPRPQPNQQMDGRCRTCPR